MLGLALGLLAWVRVSGAPESESFRVRRWTVDDGLPQNRINALAQTPDGYLWCGTWFGLARFDGVRFVVFAPGNTPALTSETIVALAVGSDRTLWIATLDGLVSYRDGQFTRYGHESGLKDLTVGELSPRRAGGVWLRTDQEFGFFAGGHFTPVTGAGGAPSQSTISGLQADSSGQLTVVSDGRLWRTDASGTGLVPWDVPGDPTGWNRLQVSSDGGTFWLASRQGLFQLRAGVWSGPIPLGEGRPDESPTLFADRDGELWVSFGQLGIRRLENGRLAPVSTIGPSLPRNFSCGLADGEGGWWLGTRFGLFRLRRPPVRSFTKLDGLPDDNCWSVSSGPDGSIWVATDLGLGRIVGDKARSESSEFAGWGTHCVLAASDGSVWISRTEQGLFQWREGTVTRLVSAETPGFWRPWALARDNANGVLVGNNEGLFHWCDGQLTRLLRPEAEPRYDVRAIHKDRHGALWLGTYGRGLLRLRIHGDQGPVDRSSTTVSEEERFDERHGLGDLRIWTIHETDDGALWLGSEGGLQRFVPPAEVGATRAPTIPLSATVTGQAGQAFVFTTRQGLPETTINHILEDESGYLWLSGLRGIHRIRRSELEAVVRGETETVSCTSFGLADGMESAETNGESQPAGCKTADGRLWFPTTEGVVVIDPRKVGDSKFVPPAVLEQVIVDHEVIFGDGATNSAAASLSRSETGPEPGFSTPPTARVRLSAGRARVIEFLYTLPTLEASEKSQFRVRLRGLETEWREPGTQRRAYYTNLKPGDYVFEVKAANAHGIWGDQPASFRFSVIPHWWQTWPFYLVSSAGAIALAGFIVSYRLRVQDRIARLEQAAALERERSRIAHDLHDELGSGLAQVALLSELADTNKSAGRPAQQAARELLHKLDDIVWALNPARGDVASVVNYLVGFAEEFVAAAGIGLRLNMPPVLPDVHFDATRRHHLLLAFKEMVRNAITHSGAQNITVEIVFAAGMMHVTVRDDGIGFDPARVSGQRHGLFGLRQRADSLGGVVEFQSAPGQGTKVVFRVPAPTGKRSHHPA